MAKHGRPRAEIDMEMALALLAHTSIKVSIIQEVCGVSYETFIRCVTENTGLTPLKYRHQKWDELGREKEKKAKPKTQKWLEAVKTDLRETRLSNKELAKKYDRASGHALDERFRQLTGQSCAQYRNQAWEEHGAPPELKNPKIELAKEFLATKGWSVEKVAVRSGYHSRAGLQRAFKNAVGMLPLAYRAQEFKKQGRAMNPRVEKAKRLLETTNLSVKDVAQKCGYVSDCSAATILDIAFANSGLPSPQAYRMQYHLVAIQTDLADPAQDIDTIRKKYGFHHEHGVHFSRHFKKLIGIAPEEYRDQVRRAILGGAVAGVVARTSKLPEPLMA